MQDAYQTENACRGLDDPERFISPEVSSLSYGDVCYINSLSQRAKAKADSSTTLPGVAIHVGHHQAQYSGLFTKHDWAWTPGNLLYVSDTTAGALTASAPTTGGTYKQAVAVAITATTILFLPSLYMVAN